MEDNTSGGTGVRRPSEAVAWRVVAADVHLTGGSVELDQSMLTGESLPIDAGSALTRLQGLWCGEARPPLS